MPLDADSAPLSFEDLAGQLAESLNSIPEFPWKPEVVIATAEDLIRWCTGASVEGEWWDAEKQARWLVTEARETWKEWKGTAGLKALFYEKFPPPTLKPGNAVTDWANEPCVCGSGEKFGACCYGKPVFTPEELAVLKPLIPPRREPRGSLHIVPVAKPSPGPYVRSAEEQARLDRIAEDIARVDGERKKGA